MAQLRGAARICELWMVISSIPEAPRQSFRARNYHSVIQYDALDNQVKLRPDLNFESPAEKEYKFAAELGLT